MKGKVGILFIVMLFACTAGVYSQEQSSEATETAEKTVSTEKFNPGDFIFEHIKDAYNWHIFTIKKKDGEEVPVSIPLPVIVYSKDRGLNIFMATRFNHGESSYHGFYIAQEGEYKGKILEKTITGEVVRPLDLSFSKDVLAVFISLGLMLWIFISIANSYKKNEGKPPSGLQSVLEPIILFVRDDIAKASIGKNYERYMPFLLTIFFFIWINNLMGIIPIFPGGANVTGNITVTMALALLTFAITTFVGNKHYWKDMVNAEGVPWWLKLPIPLMPIIEIMGMFIKPFVLMIRLFANMAAGHIIALGFISLIFIFGTVHPAVGYGMSVLSISFTVFMTLLELLVALIQAYVFTLLSALYFGLATQEHH
ncbi:MAG TPA: F0F1 ATP synthase subunit A [Bacteroidales bacterium]|nr:F0F1 ATP synthase subunit A [Bacteroidales bacterium]